MTQQTRSQIRTSSGSNCGIIAAAREFIAIVWALYTYLVFIIADLRASMSTVTYFLLLLLGMVLMNVCSGLTPNSVCRREVFQQTVKLNALTPLSSFSRSLNSGTWVRNLHLNILNQLTQATNRKDRIEKALLPTKQLHYQNSERNSDNNNKLQIGNTYSNSSSGDKSWKPVLFARVVSWMLERVVRHYTKQVKGLEIQVHSESNQHVMQGKLGTIEMKFDQLTLAHFFVSGGGKVIVRDFHLRVKQFLFQNLQTVRKPYSLYCDVLLTQQDIVNSAFIRNLIQQCVDNILLKVLNTRSIVNITIRKVTINAKRVQAVGVVSLLNEQLQKPMFGISGMSKKPILGGLDLLDFEVSTGAGVREEGQTLLLQDIQVVLNPESPLLRTVMPMPMLSSDIDVHLGQNFKIQSLIIADKHIRLCADSIISPTTTAAATAAHSASTLPLLLKPFIVVGGITGGDITAAGSVQHRYYPKYNDANNHDLKRKPERGAISSLNGLHKHSASAFGNKQSSHSNLYSINTNIHRDVLISQHHNEVLKQNLKMTKKKSRCTKSKALFQFDLPALLSQVLKLKGGIISSRLRFWGLWEMSNLEFFGLFAFYNRWKDGLISTAKVSNF